MDKVIELTESLRDGSSVQCPACKKGNFMAHGDPKTAHLFACDKCDYRIFLTVSVQK